MYELMRDEGGEDGGAMSAGSGLVAAQRVHQRLANHAEHILLRLDGAYYVFD